MEVFIGFIIVNIMVFIMGQRYAEKYKNKEIEKLKEELRIANFIAVRDDC
jgi:hypothetical protein